jgi:hypothetical protein
MFVKENNFDTVVVTGNKYLHHNGLYKMAFGRDERHSTLCSPQYKYLSPACLSRGFVDFFCNLQLLTSGF